MERYNMQIRGGVLGTMVRGGTGVAMYGSQPTTTVQIKPATYNLRALEPAQPTTSKTRAP